MVVSGISSNDMTTTAALQDASIQQALILAYEQTIGRDPAPSELAGSQQLQSGAPILALRADLAATGDVAAAVVGIYTDVLGRAVTAPELASDENDLANGGSLAGLRSYLATTNEAAGKLQSLYTAVVGRAATIGDLSRDGAAIGAGTTTLASLRGYFATTNEAAGKLQSVYADVVGRAATAGELSSGEAAIGTGATTLASLRSYFTTTTEAAGKLRLLYVLELGRAITPSELAADQTTIANGSSLAAIRTYLSTSAEAVTALRGEYHNAFGYNLAPADLVSAQQSLAGGSSLLFSLASLPSSLASIRSDFRTLVGVAPSAGEVDAAERGIEAFTSLNKAVTTVAASSPEFANAINTAYQATIGRSASAVELAGDRSELGLGAATGSPYNSYAPVTIATLKTQIAELVGGAPPGGGGNVQITPQTIAGVPGFVTGLLNNDLLISRQEPSVGASLNGSGSAGVVLFDPAVDILEIQSRQAANFGALTLSYVPGYDSSPYNLVGLGGGATITLELPGSTQVTAANFRFI